MAKVILHQFPRSHYCHRIRWALALKGIPFEIKNYKNTTIGEVTKLTGGNWSLVPVLQWDDEKICDSPKIARFLEEKKPTPTLYPGMTTPAMCDMVNGWVDVKVMLTAAKFMVREFLASLDDDADRTIYRGIFQRAHGMSSEDAAKDKEKYGKDLLVHWTLLEEQLKNRKFLLDDEISYADLGVASRFRLMEIVGQYQIPAEFPRIRDWYSSIRRLGP